MQPRAHHPEPRLRRLAVLLALGCALTVVTGGLAPAAQASVPSKRGVYLGLVGEMPSTYARSGARFAAHHYGYFEKKVPTGRMITVRFAAQRSWASTAALTKGSQGYADIARWANTLRKRHKRVLVAFHHEPESTVSSRYGSAADYRRAFRKVVTIFRHRHARNVSFVWQMTGWAFSADSRAYNAAGSWYPGDRYVDIVGADPYNWNTCGHGRGRWRSLKSLATPVLRFAKRHHKQVAIAEFASVRDPRRPAWIRAAGRFIANHDRRIAAAFYFNRPPTNSANAECTWPLSTDADFAALRKIRRMGVFKT